MVMERFYRDPRTLARMGEGSMGPFVQAFAAQLSEQGYTRGSGRLALRLVASFSRWIDRRGNRQSVIGLKRSNSISRCWSQNAIDWSGVITVPLQLRLHV